MKKNIIVAIAIICLSAFLTKLWLTGLLNFPLIPGKLSIWLIENTPLAKGDTSILFGLTFYTVLLSFLYISASIVLTKLSKGRS